MVWAPRQRPPIEQPLEHRLIKQHKWSELLQEIKEKTQQRQQPSRKAKKKEKEVQKKEIAPGT